MTEQVTLSLSMTIKGFSVVSEAEVDSKVMLKSFKLGFNRT